MPNEGESLDVAGLQLALRMFAEAREWERFHSPKNLAMALAGESGELLEIFQWLTEEESNMPTEEVRARAAEELADIQIYLLRLADLLDVPLPEAVRAKIEQNADKYPAERSRGQATKYTHPEDA